MIKISIDLPMTLLGWLSATRYLSRQVGEAAYLLRLFFGGLSLICLNARIPGRRPMNKILISACLAGFNVRYNGSAKTLLHSTLAQWHAEGRLVICCPELAAGFSTPRPPAEITAGPNGGLLMRHGAKVIESTGADVTNLYILGAHLALRIAQHYHCRYALLADGSPSCGSETVYSGKFDGQTVAGRGVTAQLLREHGIRVFSHRQVNQLIVSLRQDQAPTR